jgi:hypothetical protein
MNTDKAKDNQKSHTKVMNPGGQLEDSGLHSHSKISGNTPRMRSGREVREMRDFIY